MGTQAYKVKNGEAESGAVASTASGFAQKVTETVRDSREFLHDVRLEMKQVTWPTRDDVVSTTWVVVATVAFFAVFLFFVDQGIQHVVQYVLKKFGG
jgi:preprotein translocase subunit SecE